MYAQTPKHTDTAASQVILVVCLPHAPEQLCSFLAALVLWSDWQALLHRLTHQPCSALAA